MEYKHLKKKSGRETSENACYTVFLKPSDSEVYGLKTSSKTGQAGLIVAIEVDFKVDRTQHENCLFIEKRSKKTNSPLRIDLWFLCFLNLTELQTQIS